jgi:hypothetical protein
LTGEEARPVRDAQVRAAMRRTGKPLRPRSQARAVQRDDLDWAQRNGAGHSVAGIARGDWGPAGRVNLIFRCR